MCIIIIKLMLKADDFDDKSLLIGLLFRFKIF